LSVSTPRLIPVCLASTRPSEAAFPEARVITQLNVMSDELFAAEAIVTAVCGRVGVLQRDDAACAGDRE
jgi:hypothetical protein